MGKLVIGGRYVTAYSWDLYSVFNGIAESILASPKDVTLRTNAGSFPEAAPKYIKLTITAKQPDSFYTETDTITGKLVYNMGQAGAVPAFTITVPGTHTTFDGSGSTVNGNKILLPLNNLKYEQSGTLYFIESITVEVSDDGVTFRESPEDSSTSANTKKAGVVLVIDCSRSLGDTFSSVQYAAQNFIDTLNGN
jgi:hypothetical protein